MVTQNELLGGATTPPNRAPAAKVLAGALANNRVAQALITALGSYTLANAIVATSTSTTVDFGSLQVGDYVAYFPATAGNSRFGTVATAGTLPFAGIVGDLYLVIRKINLDATNPLVPPPPAELTGRTTGQGGQEF